MISNENDKQHTILLNRTILHSDDLVGYTIANEIMRVQYGFY